jgi:hypothetical protein
LRREEKEVNYLITVKTLAIAILTTCLLTTVLFSVQPAQTANNYVPPTPGVYDAWVDINDDGQIDIFDIIYIATGFGTSGDPAKNVSIANWPATLNVNVTNMPVFKFDEQGNLNVTYIKSCFELSSPFYGVWIEGMHSKAVRFTTAGYSKIWFWVFLAAQGDLEVTISAAMPNDDPIGLPWIDHFTLSDWGYPWNVKDSGWKSYEIRSSETWVSFANKSTDPNSNIAVEFYIYVTA